MERYPPQYPPIIIPKSNNLGIMIGGTVFIIIILILVFIFSGSTSDTSSILTSTQSIDCVGEWEKDCSQPCGNGTLKYKVSTPKQGDGKSCPEKDGASKTCKIMDCSVNCVGDWETCSEPCGEGSHNYKVTIPKEGDGKSCPEEDGAYKTCKIKDCPVNCVGEWGECIGNNFFSPYCGDGTQKYKVTTLAKGDGTICEAVDGASKPCKLRDCNCNYSWGCGTLIAKCWDGGQGCRNDCYKTCY